MWRAISLIILLSYSLAASAKVNVPVDTDEHIYGLGVDINPTIARQGAIADIVQKLSVQVSSSVDIVKEKQGNTTVSQVRQNSSASSVKLQLSDIQVVENVEKKGKWWVVVKASRAMLQQTLGSEVAQHTQAITRVLNEYKASPGPACWFELGGQQQNMERLQEIAPLFAGSGGAADAVSKANKLLTAYNEQMASCSQNNRYTLEFDSPIPKSMQRAIKKELKKLGFKFAKESPNTGVLVLDLSTDYKHFHSNHIIIHKVAFEVEDELQNSRYSADFKAKGSSLSNKNDALKKAENALLTKLTNVLKSHI